MFPIEHAVQDPQVMVEPQIKNFRGAHQGERISAKIKMKLIKKGKTMQWKEVFNKSKKTDKSKSLVYVLHSQTGGSPARKSINEEFLPAWSFFH